MDGAALGAGLRAMRTLRGLTLVETARRAGVSRKSLQRWESGEQSPRGNALAALLATLEASPQERAALLADATIAQAKPSLANTPLGPPAHPGRILRAVRERRGLTQTQLARAIGVSQAAVAKWESGRAMPAHEALGRIAVALGVEELGLREGSLDLYDPIVDPDDARLRIREITTGRPDSVAWLLAVERELWPLAARELRWREALAETLAYRAWAHLEAAEFTAAVEVAQRALRLAESASAWGVVFRAVESVQAIRHLRGADPSRNARFVLDCAAKVREPFARATLLNRAGYLAWAFDPRRTDRLFHESEELVRRGEPGEFAGTAYRDAPIFLEDLPRWGAVHAIARKDSKRATEFYDQAYAADWEHQLDGELGIDVAMIVVGVHRLAGARPPDAVLEWLDAGARQADGFWARLNFRRINDPLGLFVPNVPHPR